MGQQITALFMRVSTKDQRHDRQRTILRDWTRSQGLRDRSVKWYAEKVSGMAAPTSRTGLAALLRDVEAGTVHTVAVERLDRLSRSTRKGLEVLATLADKGCRVVAVKQALDLSGAMGKFLATLFLALGEWERDQLSARITEGMEAARENGKHVGRPRDEKRRQQVAKMRQEGMSVQQIATELSVTRQTIYYLMQHREGVEPKAAVG